MVGIITMAYNSDNTNFITAYAINDVRNLMQNLVNKKSMPYLGIKGQTVTDEIAATNKIPKGIYISAVETNSPAYKSGIQSGDVITQINGTGINNMESFMIQLEKVIREIMSMSRLKDEAGKIIKRLNLTLCLV